MRLCRTCPNECHCGCGEFLPIGSKREYKRGHRQRVTENYEDKLAEALPEGEGNEFWGDSPTLEDIAAITPDDPLPFDLKNTKGNAPDIKITKRVRDDVEGKIAFMISVTGSMAAMIDPVCGGAFLANGDAVAGKLRLLFASHLKRYNGSGSLPISCCILICWLHAGQL